MRTDKKNLRRISIVVTAQTKGNLERLAAVSGYKELGRVVDKLTREKMISLHVKENDAICGATNLPCIKCNPGGCDNRKEGAYNEP